MRVALGRQCRDNDGYRQQAPRAETLPRLEGLSQRANRVGLYLERCGHWSRGDGFTRLSHEEHAARINRNLFRGERRMTPRTYRRALAELDAAGLLAWRSLDRRGRDRHRGRAYRLQSEVWLERYEREQAQRRQRDSAKSGHFGQEGASRTRSEPQVAALGGRVGHFGHESGHFGQRIKEWDLSGSDQDRERGSEDVATGNSEAQDLTPPRADSPERIAGKLVAEIEAAAELHREELTRAHRVTPYLVATVRRELEKGVTATQLLARNRGAILDRRYYRTAKSIPDTLTAPWAEDEYDPIGESTRGVELAEAIRVHLVDVECREHGHTWGPPTWNRDGVRAAMGSARCSRCGRSRVVERVHPCHPDAGAPRGIPPAAELEHDWAERDADGYTWRECTRCGDTETLTRVTERALSPPQRDPRAEVLAWWRKRGVSHEELERRGLIARSPLEPRRRSLRPPPDVRRRLVELGVLS